MSLQIQIEELTTDAAVVIFDGSLTLGMSLSLVDSQVRGLIDKGFSKLLFDMQAVTYCDSAGLGLIVHTFGLANQKGGVLRLCCLSERVEGVLKMSTTDTFLPVSSDRASGIAALA